MNHRFETLQDALAAGYTLPSRQYDKDVSGPNSFGYDYEDDNGNRTVDVYFTKDLNRMRQPGCVRPMFPPQI